MGARLPAKLKKLVKGGRLFVIFDAQVFALHGRSLERVLAKITGLSTFVIPPGERSKSQTQLNRLRDYLLSENISRTDLMVAVGGGVTSDLVGYAAATTLRGIDWIVVPTTLLGMVDAATGGKTGINHSRGKNLIGAFWQPKLVWCDTRYLMTLPARELVSGLGEVLKYAGLMGEPMIEKLEDFMHRDGTYDGSAIAGLIESCVRYKAAVVAADELDTGKRMVLNFGHTFGHAIETGAIHGRLRHGEALIVGLKAALRLSDIYSPNGKSARAAYSELVEHCLRLVPRRKINFDQLNRALDLDKKRGASGLNFILLQKPGRPIIIKDVKLRDVKASLRHALKDFNVTGRLNG
jgi:3-dehydroquinate synthase